MISTQPSLIISSPEPKKLLNFYSSLIDGIISPGVTSKDFYIEMFSPCRINFFKPSGKQGLSKLHPPSVALCLEQKPSSDPISCIEKMIDEILALGAKLIAPPKLEPFGAEAWFYDIDDNKFLVFVPLAKS